MASAKVAALELEAGLALARVEGKQALEAANDAASAQITELSRSLQAKVDRYEEESGARSVAHDRRVMVRALHRMCDRQSPWSCSRRNGITCSWRILMFVQK